MASKSKKQKYVKMDPIQHILVRPDMYVGSTRSRQIDEYVVIDNEYHIGRKTIDISPAILRIFIEPLSNAIDNVARSRQSGVKMTKICIDVDKNTGLTSFWNDGDVIPIEMHPEEKCYNHSLIFGQLLTGSNYNDEEDRLDISGKNGLGCKVVSVFSKEFTVEGVDPDRGKKLTQVWRNNMRETSEPEVINCKLKTGYTRVSYIPDFSQFGIEGYSDDIIALYKRLAVDTAVITKLKVVFNDEAIPVESLADYARLYGKPDGDLLCVKTKDCEVAITPAENGENKPISFANGIYTPLGGTHVDAWEEAFYRPIVEKFNKPKKPQITIADVRKFFRLFVIATVNKPEFDSQSKTKLEGPVVNAEVKRTHILAICKWAIIEQLEDIIRTKELVVLKKAERKKRGYEKVKGLEPANYEGGAKGHLCTLILVEGLSAKTYAANGINKGVFGRTGRDWNGILALTGKILNTRNATPASIAKNKIVTDIIKAIGLQHGIDYTVEENYKKLRYGRVLIITDADTDGLHISGLIQNLFHSLFPSLLQREEAFLISMQTPIVRVFLGKKDRLFYDEREYHRYVTEMQKKFPKKKIDKKYYKGLGASNDEDVAETFGQKLVEFVQDDKTVEAMTLAFNNKYSDQRKEWLEKYDPDNIVLRWNGTEEEKKQISFSQFINTELIKFSLNDCQRSIPNLMDGLKEGHRKVLFACFLRNLKYAGKVLKVAQLSGYVAEKTAYHHGEDNLHKTITGMANAYVGSNNIPLLFRDGQFGSRAEGGKDAAAGRYIHTKLDGLTRLIFRPEDDDLLDYIDDDGEKVEPRFYVPIIPMILVNGCLAGIGTGWSSYIPCYNPTELIDCIRIWLDNDGEVFTEDGCLFPDLVPWYRGHTGEMTKASETKYISHGRVEQIKNGQVRVTELPVGMWTADFVEYLETLREEKRITKYVNHSDPKTIDFVITENEEDMACTEDTLGLTKSINTTNMVMFTTAGKLKRFGRVAEIIDAYCQVRYEYYRKRKARQLDNLSRLLKLLGNKKRFLEEVRDGVIKLFEMVGGKRQSRKTADLIAELTERGYDRSEIKAERSDEEEKTDDNKEDSAGYEYLLRLQISSITAEKITKLANEIASTQESHDTLLATSEKDIWRRELTELITAYQSWLPIISNEKVKKSTKKK